MPVSGSTLSPRGYAYTYVGRAFRTAHDPYRSHDEHSNSLHVDNASANVMANPYTRRRNSVFGISRHKSANMGCPDRDLCGLYQCATEHDHLSQVVAGRRLLVVIGITFKFDRARRGGPEIACVGYAGWRDEVSPRG